MGIFGALEAGRTGLAAAGAGIRATSQNVANASTAGFTRRRVDQSTADPIRSGRVWLGQGARVDRIGRSADLLTFGRVIRTSGDATAAGAHHAALAEAEGLFEPSAGTSLRQAVDGVFDALGGATADPSDPSLRRQVTSALGEMARTMRGIATGLQDGIAERDARVAGALPGVNADLAEVAALNERIAAAGGGLAAPDLADRRDTAIHRLADAVGATVRYEGDGSATVLLGGHAAVSGPNARTVRISADPAGGAPTLTLSVDAGAVDVTADAGGAIGGELAARSALAGWLADTDALAGGLATALNTRNAAGFDVTGAPGGPLFTLPGSGSVAVGLALDPGVAADPGRLAFAAGPGALPGDGGNLTAFLADESAIVANGRSAGAFASDLTGRAGADTSLAATEAATAEAMAGDADELYANLTSVDFDEEAVKLLQFQAAYQAAAKVIQATDEMLGTLLSIVR